MNTLIDTLRSLLNTINDRSAKATLDLVNEQLATHSLTLVKRQADKAALAKRIERLIGEVSVVEAFDQAITAAVEPSEPVAVEPAPVVEAAPEAPVVSEVQAEPASEPVAAEVAPAAKPAKAPRNATPTVSPIAKADRFQVLADALVSEGSMDSNRAAEVLQLTGSYARQAAVAVLTSLVKKGVAARSGDAWTYVAAKAAA